MKLCLFLYWMKNVERDALFERVRVADEIGVHSVWVSEGPGRDVFATMTQIAEKTSHVQIGCSIVNAFSRTPAALAQHFATLDEISGGRMLIGIGAGRKEVIEAFHGMPFHKPLQRVRECVNIINILVSGEKLAFDGEIFKLNYNLPLDFVTIRKHIPVFIGALSPASIRQTAEIADGWLPAWTPIETLPELIKNFRQQAARAGRISNELMIRSPGTTIVTKYVDRAKEIVAQTFATYIAGKGDLYYRHLSRLGYQKQADQIRKAWVVGGVKAAAEVISPSLQQSVGFVTSSIEEARDRIVQEAEAGVDLHSVEVQAESRQELQMALEALHC